MKRRRRPAAPRGGPPRETAPSPRGVGEWLVANPWVYVVMAGLVAFAGALPNRFSYDDQMVVAGAEPLFRDLPLFSTIFSRNYFLTSHESTFRPVVTLSYALDYAVGGLGPFAYHLQSVLWHVGCAVLVYALARRLLPRAGRGAALAAGLVFAVHPVLTEAIDNVSFREDPLATFFTLLALLLALRNTSRALWGALAAYLVALFAKESAVVMPLLLIGARYCLPDEPGARRRRWREVAGFGAVTAFFVLIRFVVLTSGPDYAEYAGGTMTRTVLGTPVIFAHYLRLLVVPWPLCADYSGLFRFPPATGALVVSLLVVLAYVAAAGWLLLRRDRVGGFGLAWFLLGLGPVANLVPIPVPAAERFLYLPFAGVALAVGAGAAALLPRLSGRTRGFAIGAGLLVVAAFAVVANLRHPTWRDNVTLWSTTVRDHPRSWGARHGLGVVLKERGDLDAARRELEGALAAGPTKSARALILNDLGIVYGMQGRLDDSVRVLREAIAITPHAKSYLNLGITLAQQHDRAGAAQAYEEAARRNPLYARAFAMLAGLRLEDGKPEEAEALLAKAARIAPKDPTVVQMQEHLARQRRRGARPGMAPTPR